MINRNLKREGVCRADSNATVIIVLSHGVWEAAFYNGTQTPFDFEGYLDNDLALLRRRCRHRRYKVMLMTQPHTQSLDGRDTMPDVQDKIEITDPHLRCTCFQDVRLNAINNYYWKMAEKRKLPLIDAAAVSLNRQDSVYDGVHYVLVDPHSHQRFQNRNKGQNGNEVTATFMQMILRATLQLFD